MSATGKECIQLRNEGAAAFVALAEEMGTKGNPDWDAARKELKRRVGMKCNIAIKQKEQDATLESIREAVANTYLALVYSVLHDSFGFGKDRLKRFKADFDETVLTAYYTDRMGRRYFSVAEVGEDMNRLYDMGIDITTIEDTENSVPSIENRVARVDEVIGYLNKHGQEEAGKLVWRECYGRDCEATRFRTKEQRNIAKAQRKKDRNYKMPNMNLFDPEVSAGYLSIIATVMRENGSDFAQIDSFCQKVNEYLAWILESGREAQETLQRENEDFGIGDKEAIAQ